MLASTQRTLSHLQLLPDLTPSQLAVAILRDPLFACQILRVIQQKKNKLRIADITTVEHSLMMFGVDPFYEQFGHGLTIEETLEHNTMALQAIRAICKRSYIASRLAQDWAAKSKDIESEEVQVAALIHDVAEVMLWLEAPGHALLIKKMMEANPTMRSAAIQTKILGFTLNKVTVQMGLEWGLPPLLLNLLSGKATTPRMKMVTSAVKLARHSAKNWDDPALPDDWKDAATILNIPTPEDAEAILRLEIDELSLNWNKHNIPGFQADSTERQTPD